MTRLADRAPDLSTDSPHATPASITIDRDAQARIVVALLGNPNTGKTTLFNRLTGLRHKTSNFPGTTIEARIGRLSRAGVGSGGGNGSPDGAARAEPVDAIDLPGIYSLELDLLESEVCRAVLEGRVAPRGQPVAEPSALCIVADATNLPRSLMLVGEALRRRLPTVIALNMIDLARARAIAIDAAALTPSFMTLWATNTAAGVAQLSMLLGRQPTLDDIEGLTMSLYEQGRSVTAVQHIAAQQALFRVGRVMAIFHETYDAWLTPTLGSPPLKLGTIDVMEQDIQKAFAPILDYVPYTAMQNATGQPAINVPLHWNKDNLPIGVQFVARTGNEMLLLKLAAELEKAAPWAQNYSKVRV